MPFFGELIDVTGESERHDVGLEAVDHGTGLLAGAAVRLLDRDIFARRRLPMLGECHVEVLIELARRVIRYVEKLDRLGSGCRSGDAGCQAQGQRQAAGNKGSRHANVLFSLGS